MSFWKWFSTKFHTHEWEVHQEMPLNIYKKGYISESTQIVAKGVRYVLKCKICGDIKFRDSI
jgi:hypothetical protein